MNILITGGAGFSRQIKINLMLDDFYYVYILLSQKDGKKYTGYTQDLFLRFQAHQEGKVQSTKHRRPFDLIYFEGCINQKDVLKRENT